MADWPGMTTHERKIRIAWVETDAPPPVIEEAAPDEAPPAVVVDEVEQQRIAARRDRTWSIALWVTTCSAFLAAETWLFPAFSQMFKEVGLSLPTITEVVLGTPRFVYALGVLSILHAATIVRDPETRGKLRVAAFLALILGVALTAYALLAPIAYYDDRM